MNTIAIAAVVVTAAAATAYGAGYVRGGEAAASRAAQAMLTHIEQDAAAERSALARVQAERETAYAAQNLVAEAYERGKKHAQKTAADTIDQLRAGTLRLHDRWASCQAGSAVPPVAASPTEPVGAPDDRGDSAARIVHAAAACDAQVKALQSIVRVGREPVHTPQPEVGQNTGSLGAP